MRHVANVAAGSGARGVCVADGLNARVNRRRCGALTSALNEQLDRAAGKAH